MERRQVFGLLGAAGLTACVPSPGTRAEAADDKGVARPPRLDAEALARLIKGASFRPESLYAHEIEFRAVVKIKRDVPLLQIKGMDGPYSQVHLYGSGGNFDVGKELDIVGLIVDNGFGALMVWKRTCKYADA